MDLGLLQTFVTVAATRNISRAAEQVHLSQPAVSLQIKQLEATVGTALFARHPLRLTDAGEHLLVNAQQILAQWQQTLEFVQAEQSLVAGKLTIACSDTLMRFTLLDKIALFNQQFPQVHMSILNRTTHGAQQAVLMGEADLAIALYEQDHAKLIHRPLLEYQEVAAVNPQHALAAQNTVTAHRLVQENLLLLEERTLSRKLIMDWFASKQLRPEKTMSLGSVDAQVVLARLQLGVAIIPEFALPEDLVRVGIRGLRKRKMVIFYQRLKPAAQAWFRLIEPRG